MDKKLLPFLFVISMMTLTACSTTTPPDQKRAGVCNTLRSALVFNGSTSNVREAEIQNSQTPLQQQNYDSDDCDDQ